MESSPMYKWLVVAMLWLVATLNYVDRQAIFSVFPMLRQELGSSDVALGLMGTVFLWVYGGLSPFVGYLGDRFSRRNIILGSLAVWSLVTFATGYARTTGEIIALRGLMGVSEACYMPTALALIADYHGPARRSTAIGLHQSGIYIGSAIGGTFAGFMADHFGWRSAFHYLGAFGVLLSGILLLALRDAPKGSAGLPVADGESAAVAATFRAHYLAILRIPTMLILTLVVMIFSVYFWAFTAWLPLFFYEKFGMSMTKAAVSATMYTQAASVLGILIGGPLADYGRRRDIRARMWVQLFGIALPAPFLLLLGLSGSVFWVVGALVIFGLGRGLWDCNNMPVICEVAPPNVRATAYGFFNFAGMLGGGIGTLVFGLLARHAGLGTMLAATAPLALLAGVMVWTGMKRYLVNDMQRLAAVSAR